MLTRLYNILDSFILTIITNIEGNIGSRFRYLYYSKKLRNCSGYIMSSSGFRIFNPSSVSIGRGCHFNHGVIIDSNNNISIGDDVLVGPYTVIRDSNHRYENPDKTISSQGHNLGNITIGNDVWIGATVVLIDGANVKDHSIIAAHSLVNKEIPSCEVWGGVPAKFLKKRGESKHERIGN